MNTADFSFTKFGSTWCSCLCFTGSQLNFLGAKWFCNFWPIFDIFNQLGVSNCPTRKERITSLGLQTSNSCPKTSPSQEHTPFEGISWDQDTPKIEGLVGFICWWHMLPLVGKYVTILLVSSCSPTNIKEAEHDTTILNRQWPLKLGLYLSYILLISCGTSWWRK